MKIKKGIITSTVSAVQFLFMFTLFVIMNALADKLYGNAETTWVFWTGLAVLLASISLTVWGIYGSIYYTCNYCGEKIYPPFWKWFFACHTLKSRTLYCEKCGKKTKCKGHINN